MKKEFITVRIEDLIPYENNPRKIEEAIPDTLESMRQVGVIDPIEVDEDNIILSGHTRLAALKQLGETETEVVRVSGLTEDQKKKYRILANKVGEKSQWDFDKLNIELEDLDFDDYDFGFDSDVLGGGASAEPFEDDYEENLPVEPRSKVGDLYRLGEHRLICGDSTDATVIDRLMDGAKADMIFTDPPYNVDFQGSMSNTTKNGIMVKHKGANQRHDDIKNDKMPKEEYYQFICKILDVIKENVQGAWYISFSAVNIEELLNPLRDSGMDWKSIIVWMKNQATLSMKDYKSRYEPIVYGRFNDNFYGEKAKEEDIWEFQRTLKNDLHPTMKPIPLICNMLEKSSKNKDRVLDLFGGSGSTLIACEQLNRRCYMCELDPHYVDVIIDRWEQFTGKKAELIN